MEVWITKYALSEGIVHEPNAENHGDKYIARPDNKYMLYSPGQWHISKEEAIAVANAMRLKRIASLKKQLQKLEKMTF